MEDDWETFTRLGDVPICFIFPADPAIKSESVIVNASICPTVMVPTLPIFRYTPERTQANAIPKDERIPENNSFRLFPCVNANRKLEIEDGPPLRLVTCSAPLVASFTNSEERNAYPKPFPSVSKVPRAPFANPELSMIVDISPPALPSINAAEVTSPPFLIVDWGFPSNRVIPRKIVREPSATVSSYLISCPSSFDSEPRTAKPLEGNEPRLSALSAGCSRTTKSAV